VSIHSKSARRRRGSRPSPPYQSSVQYSCCWARRWSHSSRSRAPPGISSARTDLRPTRTRCRSTGRFHALMIFCPVPGALHATGDHAVAACAGGRPRTLHGGRLRERTYVGTVDRRVVSPVKNRAPCTRTICWERCTRISSWPGCNSSLLARGRITFTQAASDSRTKDLATPGPTIHFLPAAPSRRRCRAPIPLTASSASGSHLPASAAAWPPTHL
jgi:hypothetical protein